MINVKFSALIRCDKLRPRIIGQHLQIAQLAPLVDINQQLTQFSIVLVDQIGPTWTNAAEGQHCTATD